MDSSRRGAGLALIAALVVAAPASASFPGKAGQLTYTGGNYRDGTTSIWAQSPFGGAPRELIPHRDSAERPTVAPISDEDASWAPSGKRFVFARRLGGGDLRLYVTEAGMKKVRAIPLPDDMYTRSPSFAPDGRTIVFVEVLSGGDPAEEVTYEAGWNVWTVRTDGSGLRRLGAGDEPVWSPRGGVIAFRDSCGSLKTMRTDGSHVRTIVAAKTSKGVCNGVGRPEFSPNGRRIAFTKVFRHAGGRSAYEIFTIGTDGHGLRRVTTMQRGSAAYEPVWSPDGGSIAFHRSGGPSAFGLYRVPASGGSQRRIARTYTPDLAWQPRP